MVGGSSPSGPTRKKVIMYTVEMEHDDITITILDDTGSVPDLVVSTYEDAVYITQVDENGHVEDLLSITPEMWEELILAIDSPEGSYIVQRNGRVVE